MCGREPAKSGLRTQAIANYTLLLDIQEEVGDMGVTTGCLALRWIPNFRVNGYIYVLYVVDRYYLFHFGDPDYDPNANEYNAATIGRLTRYTCRSSDGFRSVDPASRQILIGETKQTGFPICSDTHGVGSLVFGEDGTSVGFVRRRSQLADTADHGGAVNGQLCSASVWPMASSGQGRCRCFSRSQLVDSLNGKVLRIDPATGNGLPSNPYYDAANPRSARSRVWALGLRNPYRMSLQTQYGQSFSARRQPRGPVHWESLVGTLGNALDVVTGPKQNFGWPML